jgi:toxin ParE1/3/4
MPRFRVSDPAREDLEHILSTSAERWGTRGRERYASLIAAALREIGRSPTGGATRERSEVAEGLRSLHVRQARRASTVKSPVHVIFYRVGPPIEIVRVLHERMDPTAHPMK